MIGYSGLSLSDWFILGVVVSIPMLIGLYFTKKGAKDMQSFFLTGRTLTWSLAGFSLIATTFSADTPIWVTSLVRQYGIHYVWQFWSPAIGAALATVLFARLWRRLNIITDNQVLESRYSGKAAAVLRFFASSQKLIILPLVLGWCTKAVAVIATEVMGLSPEYNILIIIIIAIIGLCCCLFSGLLGVVWADMFQFIIATTCTIILAVLSIKMVGGLSAMQDKLSAMTEWSGCNLNIAPSIGNAPTQMSLWNAIGYFGILWMLTAVASGFFTQRILACKNPRHATYATLLYTYGYYALVSWPWIIVALCSIILLPNLGDAATNDIAYPRMIVTVLPIGLKGLMVGGLLSAFISTASTFYNVGSAYIINDVYRRFMVRKASEKHYVNSGRIVTVYYALTGAIIAILAKDVQQILTFSFVIWSSGMIIYIMRWFWWRLNAVGEVAAQVVAYIFVGMIFGKVFDGPFKNLFGITTDFSSDPNLLGARMFLVTIIATLTAVIVSLLTRPTSEERLKEFVLTVKPFKYCWKTVLKRLDIDYHEHESLGRTIVSWFLLAVSVYALLFGIGKLLLGSPVLGAVCLLIAAITMYMTFRRIKQDFPDQEMAEQEKAEHLNANSL